MGDSTRNIYFSSDPSLIPHSRHPSNSDEHIILPHFLAPLPCEHHFHSYLGPDENAQNISVQFMHSCPGQDNTQLDSDILQRHLTLDHETASVIPHHAVHPEPSHALSPYATDMSGFHNISSCDISTVHFTYGHLHGAQTFRRGSWPPQSQVTYTSWMQSPSRTRSPASEPPESTSDESYQDSDVEDVTQRSQMMNQFQIQSSQNIDLSSHHAHPAQALRPSVMTFQLSESMLQPVDDPENRHMLRSLLDMNIVADDEPEGTHPFPSSTFPSPSPIPLGGVALQGPGMRFQHDRERVTRTSPIRVPVSSPNSVPFPSTYSPTNARVGDQKPTGGKQQKKSKMHECKQCGKLFPRPSGLDTHMNSHSGAKPYKCIVPDCEKSFAVRSNAKRHLRTHGINPSSTDVLSAPRFAVGFEEPMVTQVHDAGKQPSRYRWIHSNPSPPQSEWPRRGSSSSAVHGGSRSDLTFQASMSSTTVSSSTLSTSSDDDHEEATSSSVGDGHAYQHEYNGGTDEFPGTYPN